MAAEALNYLAIAWLTLAHTAAAGQSRGKYEIYSFMMTAATKNSGILFATLACKLLFRFFLHCNEAA